MSARFWLFSLASAGAAMVSGLGLGLYATTAPRVAMADIEAPSSVTQDSRTEAYPTDLNGPSEIRCTGCEPTLAQRQMASMMDGWSGYDDPVVRDYVAQEDPENLMAQLDDPPELPARQLPANVERFAAGEVTVRPSMQFAEGKPPATEDASVPMSASY